jgi:hypothetical protein
MAVKTQYFWYFGMIGSRVMAQARMLPHRPACRKRAQKAFIGSGPPKDFSPAVAWARWSAEVWSAALNEPASR